ncbi:MAG: sugar ABC transporter permease [Hungatella sp.]|nr:sugar ABC transporter permease [Hungatella sp.]
MKKKKEWLMGYAFISIWLFGLIAFTLVPMVYSFYISLMEWDFIGRPRFIGFQNYKNIFKDSTARIALINTAYYTVFSVPLRLMLALVVALMLSKPYRGANGMRVLFYMPGIISGVAISAVWSRLFDPFYGGLNDILGRFGIPGLAWLSDVHLAMPSIILMNLMYIGTPMVVFIAAIKGVPVQLYEVAVLDGASAWRRFLHITVPMISPILFYNLIMQIIQSFQVFTNVYIMTNGGPANSTMVFVLYLYQSAFQYLRMGYGSALAWVLFAIILVLTLLVFRTSGWVYFEGKEER